VSAYSSQEELDQLKAWWKTYGGSLVVGVLLGVVVVFGYRYWTQQREAGRETASALYDQLLVELRTNKSEARASGEKLIGEYSSTPYAAMAALLLARQAHDAGDSALARQRLEWTLAHAKDVATQHTARLRLARLLLDTGEVQAVTALVERKDITGFEAEYYELKGDLAVAQSQRDAARTAYREALKYVAPGSAYVSVVNMKLDDLGPEKQP
jgi:predicted negative regulator of RcsB-dependent stress response